MLWLWQPMGYVGQKRLRPMSAAEGGHVGFVVIKSAVVGENNLRPGQSS